MDFNELIGLVEMVGGFGGFTAVRRHTFTCIVRCLERQHLMEINCFSARSSSPEGGTYYICVFHGTSSTTPLGRQFKISQEISHF